MEEWRLIISLPESGAVNMAVDEAILLAAAGGTAPPTVRFYQWSQPAITLGYFQSYHKEIDAVSTGEQGVDVIRRLTGGRAILHHRELTYSVIAPVNNRILGGTLLETYLAVSRGIAGGLKELGIPAEISGGEKRPGAGTAACFDSPSRYEVTVFGKKIVGSAQTRRNNCILQHGSVLIEKETDLLFSCLQYHSEQAREKGKRIFADRAASLNEVLGYAPEFQEVAGALIKSFAAGWGISLTPQQLSGAEMAEAFDLCRSKYGTEAWNRKR